MHVADVLIPAMKDLDNVGIPVLNRVANPIAENLFGTKEQGNFRTAAHAAAEEVSKIYKQNNLSDTEIRAWEQNLSEHMSPEQQRGEVELL